MKLNTLIILVIAVFLWGEKASSTPLISLDSTKLDNPVDVAFLKKHLKKNGPKLILTEEAVKEIKSDLASDPVVQNMYKAIQSNAKKIMTEPLLERKQVGRRLLHVSREMLYRMNILGTVYRVSEDESILNRINDEILAVCQFSDWNPSHYLDVAEMALAVAFGLDWTEGKLPKSTVQKAKQALIDLGINPSFNKGTPGWVKGNNNWNQVCNGGMIAAALMIADLNPELAAKTIARSLEGMPKALEEYGPDGVYPEGATYWVYGTAFTAMTSALLETALGQDFGLFEYPALKESAMFKVLSEAPSGKYYNFADCGEHPYRVGDLVLAWFAAKTQNPTFYQKEKFLISPEEIGKLPRYAGAGLVWLSQFEGKDETEPLPVSWMGRGANPVVIFRDEAHQYYLGGKGGRGTVNHGNMDAGSFIFELDGIRWIIDSGNQGYHNLEKTGFDLWGRCQDCQRWTLLTKNNFGHSTLSVNNELHVVEGMATIQSYQPGSEAQATIDLSPVFKGQLASAQRSFIKEGPRSLMIEDKIKILESTKEVVVQLMTTAEVEYSSFGLILKEEGKSITIENVSHPALRANVVHLDPPPHELDRIIPGLKRIEFRYPAWMLDQAENKIKIRLAGL